MTSSGLKQRIWQTVTNRSLSTWLLIAVTAMLVLGSLLPNPEYMTPDAVANLQARNPLLFDIGSHFNSRKLATGYFFGFVGIYLIISATLCSVDRIMNRRREQPVYAETEASTGDITILVPAAAPEETRAFLTDRLCRRLLGAAILPDSVTGTVIIQRGRFGFWGSIIFHTVLITALAGLVLFYLGGTRGKLVFTEGQRYRLEKSRFIHLEKEPVWGLRLPRVELELMTQYSLFAHDDPQTAIEHLARFRVLDLESGHSSVRDVKINLPLRIAGSDFLLMTGGFAPRFVISGKNGAAVRYDSFVNLKREAGTKDDFSAIDGLHFNVRFFPDLARKNGQPITKSLLMNNPAALITVTRGGNRLFDDFVPVGASAVVAGYTITIPEVRRWVELEMADEPGIGFFFAISFLGIIGILVRMLDPDEQLIMVTRAETKGTRVEFFVNSRHFSALLKDVATDCARAAVAWGEERSKGLEK
ncbi:resB-like family protein [Geobacter sp. OR-1]|uniref:cytochrome c biogenesis protein ResB n=1 Tax=Geobacter sp. OR-1 TaxID=1266765 RepID=UPI0005435F58|nr:cytochrome c biogenesis protein ResB [Geobacter sp. OR-1]GAM10210.1 resB-like family protein [Geobacter sp. OR-1]